jgi:RimJ/RimL family protein N-acetyltransferase
MTWLEPLTLAGRHVSLVPLSQQHCDDLIETVKADRLWETWYTLIPQPEKMSSEIERRLQLQAQGSMLPFTVLAGDGKAVGMTSFMNVDAVNKRVEIGSTWYGKRVQRTGLNTEAKLMLLTHAFETLDCIAVEFRTSAFNQQSQRAIARLGAKLDGVLRNHIRHQNGTLRDTVVYSIIQSEWPAVKVHLRYQLDKVR